jgi:hypothetical protein
MQRKKPKATTEANAKARAGKGNGENECKGKDTGISRVAARPWALTRARELAPPASIKLLISKKGAHNIHNRSA